MKNPYIWTCLKKRTAAFLVCALVFQNVFSAMAGTENAVEASGRTADSMESERALESGNTSFVSFPGRFSDNIAEGYDDMYYSFTLDSETDISISVESDDSSCQYGAELLDSGLKSLKISERKTGQRISGSDLPSGTYFLRVFPLSENTWEPFYVSLQKLKLSAQEVYNTDFSELHMVAALQGNDSPYRMNGLDPNYAYDEDLYYQDGLYLYQWYERDTPEYDGMGVNNGGIYPMPQSYYASWLGPVAEDVLPMSEIKPFTGNTYEDFVEYEAYLQDEGIVYKEGDTLIHVQNAMALPQRYTGFYENGEGIENPGWEAHIKAGIMNYGALTTGIYWGNLACKDEENYYYSGWDYTYAEDEDGNQVPVLENMLKDMHYQNHEVVVVGWDDDYPREKFLYDIDKATVGIIPDEEVPEATDSEAEKENVIQELSSEKKRASVRTATPTQADEAQNYEEEDWEEFAESLLPERDGAWIVRNSWGNYSGDGGYYYVSYCDKQIFGNDNTWAYTATETAGNYNKLYEVTTLPYTRDVTWTTNANMLLLSTVFTADEYGADVLKAVNFSLLNNNTCYEIAVNTGDDVGTGRNEENICAAGSKLYAGYYTVRLEKPVILEPGEPFEVILKLQGDGREILEIPLVTNDRLVASIPSEEGVCRLYDPEVGYWLDIGEGFTKDNGSNNYYGYFDIKAMCNDASLEEGETERVTAIESDPDIYYGLRDNDNQKPEPDEEASPSVASKGASDEGTSEGLMIKDGHVFQRRIAENRMEAAEPDEPGTVFPEEFDLRDEGILTPVKDQEYTNTCWSFGSTAAVESSYLINGSNLYDFNYSSGISLETDLPLTEEGTVLYTFDKNDPESMEKALFFPKLLAWDDGPVEDVDGKLRWELSGDLSSVDTSRFEDETEGTGITENGEEVLLFTPEESGMLTVKVSSADDPTKTASCRVLLLEENAVDSISVSPETMTLKAGESVRLDVIIEASEGSDAKPVFSSDNPNIDIVDDSGLVLGVSRGTTLIRVRAGGLEAVCTVTVRKPGTGGGSDRDIGRNSGGNALSGSWIFNADGSWSFSADGNNYENSWGYIYNPYGNAGAGEAGWFRFDGEGKMLTGLFRETDGSLYYLNPVSDGSLGKMLTGWQWIPDESGKEYCCYFYPNSGMPMGAMASNVRTTDGYEVDAMGRWCVNGTPQTR